MRFSNWTPEQFLDSSSLNALTSNVSGDLNAVGRATTKPGLLYPEVATFAASGLAINSTLTLPFGVCFGNGTIAHAHGAVTGLDTTAYTTSFSGLVPGSGPAVTAYLLASYGQIFENPYTNVGPPVGHPDFNPNFVPSTAYETQLDTLLLNASLTPADNVLTFELGRATLAVGATGVVLSTVFQNRVSSPNTTQVVQVSGNMAVTPGTHGGHLMQMTAPAFVTLSAASGSNGIFYGFAAQTSGVTLQTVGSDFIFGFGSGAASGIQSFALPQYAAACLHCEDGVWQIIAGSAGGIGATNPIVGQCQLVLGSSTSITLSPFQGNGLTIAGQNQAIPGAGVSVTNGGLSASTLYYVYAFMSGGSMALEISATGHATDTATPGNIGVEIKSGNSSRSLVGMVFTDASVHFNDSGALRNVASWFNRRERPLQGSTISNVLLTATVAAEVSVAARIELVSWSTEAVFASINGSSGNNTTGGTTQTLVGLDGAAAGIGSTTTAPAPNYTDGCNGNFSSFVSEGHHVLSIFGDVGAGTTGAYSAQILGTVHS